MRPEIRSTVAAHSLLLLLLSILLLTTPAGAAIVIPIADDDLILGADAIVRGRITRIQSHRDAFDQISTYVTIGLDEVYKGDLHGDELTIREMGGRVGDRAYWVFASPEFVVGEQVLLFMDQRTDGTLRTYHFYLGKFSLVTDPATGDPAAVRGVPRRVTTMPGLTGVAVPAGDVARRLEDFTRHILSRAGAARPLTARPRLLRPFASAVAPVGGRIETRQEFRFLGDPDPPSAVDPTRTLIRWIEPDSNLPVTMRINSTGEPAAPTLGFDQIRAAMKAWSRVPTSSFRFAEGPPTRAVGFQGGDGVSAISFRDPLDQIPDPIECGGVLAIAGISLANDQPTTVNGRTFHRALEGDVVVADGWEDCFDLFYQNVGNFTEVMTHELGHVLGLGHSAVATFDPASGNVGATMEPFVHFDGRGPVLHADDRAGVSFIYPGRTLTVKKSGDGSGTITSGTDGIDCGLDCVAGFAPDSLVSLTATPAPGSAFLGFQEPGCESPVPMSANRTCTARFAAAQPDLVVTALTAPASAGAGRSILVNATVRNQAAEIAAPASTLAFYLSSDALFGGDVRLAETRAIGPLAGGTSSAAATSVTIPANTSAGTYFVIAVADDLQAVPEHDEDNNARSTPTTIAIRRPDLTVPSVTVTPALTAPGSNVSITHVVRNGAAAPGHAPASTSRLTLSSNDTLGDTDDVDLGTAPVAALTAGAQATVTSVVQIPVGINPGLYRIFARANDGDVIPESSATNNTASTARALTVGPDLLVTTATASPAATTTGATVSVTSAVKNQGGPTTTSFEVGIYLSTDATFEAGVDVRLGTRRVTGGLGAGAVSGPIVTPVVVPANVSAGTHFLIVRADAAGEVPEASETNNTRATAAIKIARPDLAVTSVAATTVPGGTAASMSVRITHVVRNLAAAAGRAGATTSKLYLSPDATLDAGDPEIGSVGVAALAGGVALTVTTTVAIPGGTSPGAYFIIARANATNTVTEADTPEQANNIKATATAIVVVGADLIVTGASATAAATAPGMTVRVTTTARNQGGQAAGGFDVGIYLSADGTYEPGQDRLLATRRVPALAAGATSGPAVTPIVIPGDATGGTFLLLVRADAGNEVPEASETNNVRATTPVQVVRPDLTVLSTTAPAAAAPGVSVSVAHVVKNLAAAAGRAPASTSRLFLSTDATLEVTADTVLGDVPVGALAGGVTAVVTKLVTIPVGTAPGAYWVIAQANATSALVEADTPTQANNVKATARPLTIGADLLVTAAAAAPLATAPGKTLSVTTTVRNQGGAPTGAFDVGVYLSTDAVAGGDTLLATRRVPAGLGPGALSTAATPVGLPGNASAGTYFLIARADVNGEVMEADEGNNVRPTAAVQVVRPDLTVTSVTAPAVSAAGMNVSIGHVVRNLAPAAGVAPASTTRLYLSTDPALSSGDVVLGDLAVGTVAGAAAVSAVGRVQIPPATLPGSYWVIAEANADRRVPEIDSPAQTNNVRATAAAIVVGPDLLVTAATATPLAVAPGRSVSVTSTIRNRGGSASGPFGVGLYLSTDPVAGGDTLLASRRVVAGLGPGALSTAAMPVSIPGNLSAGTYFVVVRADLDGESAEADEANNARATAAIRVLRPDLAVLSATAPAVTAPGRNVSVSHVVRNLAAAPGVAATSTSRLYLSTDPTLDVPGDVVLADAPVVTLAGGGAATVTRTVQIPPTTPVGLYWVIAQANATGAIPEADAPALANNVKATPAPLTIGPDLVVTAATLTPLARAPGMNVSVTASIKNQGGAPAGPFDVGFYLSTDSVLGGDVPLTTRRVATGLAAGAVWSAATPVTIPGNASAGTYFLVVQADVTGSAPHEVPEAGEGNNTRGTAALQVIRPDLSVTAVTAPAVTAPGARVSVSHVVRNLAAAAGAAAGSTSRLYLSTDPSLDPGSDPVLGEAAVGPLAGGTTATVARVVTIPSATAPGQYWIIAQANATNTVPEADAPGQENNVRATAKPILVGAE